MNIDSEDRGIASEAMVEQALETIKNKSKKGLMSRIVGYVHAARHSELDRQHIDFLVKFEDGNEIPLQVKSSERGRRKFIKNAAAYRRFIPVVVVKAGEALESIINKVVGCITLAFNKLRRENDRAIHSARMRQLPRKSKDWCFRFHAPSMCH